MGCFWNFNGVCVCFLVLFFLEGRVLFENRAKLRQVSQISGLLCHFRLQQEEMVLKMLPPTSLLTHQLRTQWWGKTLQPRMTRQKRRRRRMRRKMTRAGKMQLMPTMGRRVMAAGLCSPFLRDHESTPSSPWGGRGFSKFNGFEVLFLTCFYFILADLHLWIYICILFFSMKQGTFCVLQLYFRDFPGCPVVKTPSFHCRGHGFNPCLGNWDPTVPRGAAIK